MSENTTGEVVAETTEPTAPKAALKKATTEIINLTRDQIVQADWNYKRPGTRAELETLANSIARDGSPGVLAVRVHPTLPGMFEAIDGNHRYEALFDVLEWEEVRCENFGSISKAEAVLISRRRNAAWFEEDLPAVSVLYREDVLGAGFTAEELSTFMPETALQIEEIAKLSEFDWNSLPDASAKKEKDEGDGETKTEITISLGGDLGREWLDWTKTASARGFGSPEKALAYAIRCANQYIEKIAGAGE